MNKKWDYVLDDDRFCRRLFRVYPKWTYIHSFDEEKPTDWKGVFKVYYSWAIIHQYKDDNGNIEISRRLMHMHCDECSNIVNLHHIIRWVIEEQKTYDQPTIGQPAGDWRVEVYNDKYYNFQVFDNWHGNGYRFIIDRQQAEDFANWLEQMNNRALKVCGCPI